MERVGLKGEVTDSKVPSTYKINYELDETPLISILIPNKDHIDDLKNVSIVFWITALIKILRSSS